MKYVYLTNSVVTDQAQVDPFTIFNRGYAEQFIEAPDEVTHFWKLEDGKWIAPAGPSIEEQWNNIRNQRNILLSESDWIVTKAIETKTDIPEDWSQYRQALRDITTTYSNPKDVVWPSKPQ